MTKLLFGASVLQWQPEPIPTRDSRMKYDAKSFRYYHLNSAAHILQTRGKRTYQQQFQTNIINTRHSTNHQPTAVEMKNASEPLYVVLVDSRGRSTYEMNCYKELRCSGEFFQGHIHDNPNNICTKSQVAGLCGLDLKLYFHKHEKEPSSSASSNPKDHSDGHHATNKSYFEFLPSQQTNGIATLLTFNPETGCCNYLVQGKAYVLLNDGATPLSKEQVWGIQELVREANELYRKYHPSHIQEAHMELLTWTSQYLAGTWTPHCIYEGLHKNSPPYNKKHCPPKSYSRHESGISDQATCHHGMTHVHHDGRHDCCHNEDAIDHNADNDDLSFYFAQDDDEVKVTGENHQTTGHVVVVGTPDDLNKTPPHTTTIGKFHSFPFCNTEPAY